MAALSYKFYHKTENRHTVNEIVAFPIHFGDNFKRNSNHDKNICVLFGEQQVCKNFESRRNDSVLVLKDGSNIHRPIGKVRSIYQGFNDFPGHCRHIFDNLRNIIYHMHESLHRPYVLLQNPPYFKLSLKNLVSESVFRFYILKFFE